jgi:DNA (cytosine-5)-methyltransferase 1
VNYYNEFDPFAAEWLRELIKEGLIPEGVVDERSIAEVDPADVREFTQCHFFAGIGGWSLALKLAGWPADRPVWTGSPPCQPFSVAGNQKGKDDLRHLWPIFFNLINQCHPSAIFGEQVASAIKHGWFDDLQTDLESEGYAAAMAVLPACSVNAPHKRDRLFYVAERVADAGNKRLQGYRGSQQEHDSEGWEKSVRLSAEGSIDNSWMADTESQRWDGSKDSSKPARGSSAETSLPTVALGYTDSNGRQQGVQTATATRHRYPNDSAGWDDSKPVYCKDGKYRPIPTEPTLFPLAYGVSNRVGILRGAGNAIVPQVAAEVIKAYMEAA